MVNKTLHEKPGPGRTGAFARWPKARPQLHQRAAHLEGARTQAAPGEDFQAVERQALRREGAGHRWPLSRSPDKALVFSVDEKSQIQALDRTQPGLPIKKGRCGTMTHDYKRHGTTTLFAALDVATGKVIGQCMQRHRHQEWLRFLRRIDRDGPKGSICT